MRTLRALIIFTLAAVFAGFIEPDDHFYPNHLTKKVMKQIEKAFELESFDVEMVVTDSVLFTRDFFAIRANDGARLGYGIVTLATGCQIGGCSDASLFVVPTGEVEGYEQFYFSTLYNVEGEIVSVRVLEYDSEHGYEITAKSWLKQFLGRKGGELEVGKDVDGISGATISVNSITKEINEQQGLISR